MILLILCTAVAALLLWLYFELRVRSRFWADRGVPHATPHPFLGSLDFIFKKNAGIWLRELHEKISSPFLGIWVFRQPVLVVSDPEVCKRILLSDSDLFRNRYLSSGKSDPIGGLNIFTVKEPTWSNVRRRMTYVFTAAKLKALHWLLSSKSKATIERVKQDLSNKKNTDMRSLFSDFTTDVIGTFAFGIENNAILTGDSPIRAVTHEFMKFDWFRGFSWLSIFFWPSLVDVFGFSMFPKKSVEFFRRTIGQIIKQRTASAIKKNDLLDALIKMKKEGLDEGQDFSDDLLVAQAVIMLQGGFDTNAAAMTFIVYELAFKPEIQEKLYKELAEAKENVDGADFNFTDLEKLTYLNCVIKEGVRKYPPMGWLDRIADVDYIINDNLTLPAGVPVYINAIGMHYDPKFFAKPFDFNPDRFLPENQDNIVPFSYLPFGDGPRMCIGKRFAQMTMRYLLSELVLAMEFKPLPGSTKPNNIDMEKKGLFLMPGKPLSVQFIPRK